MARLAVLASGSGTILESIINADLPVELVLTDRDCRALSIASGHGISTTRIDRQNFGYKPRAKWDRHGFTAAITRELHSHKIDLVAMAGFMTVLSPEIFEDFSDRILNTHPSLLPAFRGHHAVPQALSAGVTETGCTIHIATSDLDAGRILAQQSVPIKPGDTEPILHERIKTVERKLYPETIREYLRSLSD